MIDINYRHQEQFNTLWLQPCTMMCGVESGDNFTPKQNDLNYYWCVNFATIVSGHQVIPIQKGTNPGYNVLIHNTTLLPLFHANRYWLLKNYTRTESLLLILSCIKSICLLSWQWQWMTEAIIGLMYNIVRTCFKSRTFHTHVSANQVSITQGGSVCWLIIDQFLKQTWSNEF